MLQHLQEKEKNGNLGDSEEDDDNVITEIEEMMGKENIGINKQMKVPDVNSVKISVNKNEKEQIGKEKEKNEKISIFENKIIEEKINNAKKAAMELEMLMDKRMEMKRNKEKKGKMKQKEEEDCNVMTGKNNEREKSKDNGNNNDHGNNRGFNLGYSINRECLIMGGRKLNIPKMRQANPFEKLTKRQRVADSSGRIIRMGSMNYNKGKLGDHEPDESSSEESEEDDDDDIDPQL